MNTQNIFEDEWRACLRAHFFHVIKERDTGNERSLITVLLQTGFIDDEIAAMRAEAVGELGWTAEAEAVIEPEYYSAPPDDLQGEIEIPLAAEPDVLADSEAPEPLAAADEDEPEGPPVQLSLF